MNGVEILTSAPVATSQELNWQVFWIVGAIIFFAVFIYGVITAIDEETYVPLIICVVFGFIAGSLGGLLFGAITSKPTNYEMQYKITISDEVSMAEFCERYEVIEQDGKIFTVREKANEE